MGFVTKIEPFLHAIILHIKKYLVSMIIAGTGMGKTVSIPYGMALAGKRIFVAIPKIKLVKDQVESIIAKMDYEKIYVTYGYAAGGTTKYTSKDMIVYATYGHVKQKMFSYFDNKSKKPNVNDLDFCDVLLIDEIHGGDLDISILLALWQAAYDFGAKVPHLVTVTGTPVELDLEPKPEIFRVPEKAAEYFVEERYLDKNLNFNDPKYYEYVVQIIYEIHIKFPIEAGHMCVFAPGSAEVDKIISFVEKTLTSQQRENVLFIAIYSDSDIKSPYGKHSKNYNIEVSENTRKILVATNIVETSMTLVGCGIVIDTLLNKVKEYDENGAERLSLEYCSQDSAKQRRGRTGRTRDGICLRLCTKEFFQTLHQHIVPDIEKVPLTEAIVSFVNAGIDPLKYFKNAGNEKIRKEFNLLRQFKMIIEKESGKYKTTQIGEFASKFPTNIRLSAVLFLWIVDNNKPEIIYQCVAMIAMIINAGLLLKKPQKKPDDTMKEYNKKLQEYENKYYSKYFSKNDLYTLTNIWNMFYQIFRSSYKKSTSFSDEKKLEAFKKSLKTKIYDICENNAINTDSILKVYDFIDDVEVKRLNLGVNPYVKLDINNVKKMKTYFTTMYKDRIFKQIKDNSYGKEGDPEKYMISRKLTSNKTGNKQNIVALTMQKTGLDDKVVYKIDLFYPFSPKIKILNIDNYKKSNKKKTDTSFSQQLQRSFNFY